MMRLRIGNQMILTGCVLILLALCYLSVRQSVELPVDHQGGENLKVLSDSLSMLDERQSPKGQTFNQDVSPDEKKGERN